MKTPLPEFDPSQPAWYAVHTRSRHEKMVAGQLTAKGYEAFLPIIHTWSVRTDRKVKVARPMFGGYLFVHTPLDPQTHLGILKTMGVARLVGLEGKPAPVDPEEIESIKVFLSSGVNIHPTQHLKKGDRVRIINGPFKGVVGRLEDRQSAKRLIVSINLLNRSVYVEVPEDIVIQAEPA